MNEHNKYLLQDILAFSEWIGYNYVRLNDVWVNKFQSQLDKNNWTSTENLWIFWWNNIKLKNKT